MAALKPFLPELFENTSFRHPRHRGVIETRTSVQQGGVVSYVTYGAVVVS